MFSRTENFKQYTKYYPIVSTLIAVNLIVYVLTILPGVGENVLNYGVQSNFLIRSGEWWRVFTAMFLHAGFLHVFFNTFSLYLFGPELERIAGKTRFITIYLVSGIVGNMATYLLYDSNYVSLGASGAVFGIFGAFGALVYYTRRTMPMLRKLILPIIVISVIMTFLQSNVNVYAHLGGLVAGFLLGLVYLHPKRILSWRKQKMAGK
ncbi:rhomboid family intramembrane serine protease [Lysinibacillus xylanilyticus]|uniref:Rhomboid family intramembrane serine protease n=1 Tax=Lysinibacillus xylanilyticus TaxID=582475 RepID=A0ABT4ESA4_9BACI|nr:rhomboid family intramembrane serine protease [Lysinibacillus xylanilyticus]MCY9548542.1 rhomboid family intramembrane serine protease [Lysinibacillus xylanilyticus]MED3800523.1 rhomboid family intramembrane serine protease [Lysinibacillus xylanilyticus]